MARLPKIGSDDGTWGQVLNEYLLEAHKPDGTPTPPTLPGITVEMFGATGDGTTDDQAAIQAAVNAIANGDYFGPVWLSGNYAIKSSITLRPGVRLMGISSFNRRDYPNTFNGGKIFPRDDFSGNALFTVGEAGKPFTNPQGILIDGVSISGRRASGDYHPNLNGIYIHDTSDVRIINSYVGGFDRAGNVGRGIIVEGTAAGNCYGTTLKNCVISDNFEGLLFTGNGTTDNRISDCLFVGNTRGISIGWDDRSGSEVNLGGGGTQIVNSHLTYTGMPSGGHHIRTGAQAGDGTFSNLYFDMAGNTYTIRLGNGKNIFNGCHFLVADANNREGLIRLTTGGSQQLSVVGCNVNLQGSSVKSLVWYSAKSGTPTGGVVANNCVFGAGSGGWVAHAIDSGLSAIGDTNNGSFFLGGNVKCP